MNDGGKGSARRPGKGFSEGYDRIWRKRQIGSLRDMTEAEFVEAQGGEQEPVAWIRFSGREMLATKGYCTVYESQDMSNHSIPLYAHPLQRQQEPVAVYGYCPECGSKGLMRERRPNGNDECERGHVYPSSKALQSIKGEA